MTEKIDRLVTYAKLGKSITPVEWWREKGENCSILSRNFVNKILL